MAGISVEIGRRVAAEEGIRRTGSSPGRRTGRIDSVVTADDVISRRTRRLIERPETNRAVCQYRALECRWRDDAQRKVRAGGRSVLVADYAIVVVRRT